MHPAVTEYLDREKAANAKPKGADHMTLLAEVAQEHGLTTNDLGSMVLDETNAMGAG